jgi:hypothetical protein
MTLEITVATLMALGYALGALADERRQQQKLPGRRPRLGARPPLHSAP